MAGGGLDPPIAHSCLAYVELFLENTEVADWHLEQAIRVEKDLQSSIGSSAAYLRSNWAIPGTLASVLERWQVPQQRPFD